MLRDNITAQEGTPVLVTKVRFEHQTALFKKISTGCMLPSLQGK